MNGFLTDYLDLLGRPLPPLTSFVDTGITSQPFLFILNQPTEVAKHDRSLKSVPLSSIQIHMQGFSGLVAPYQLAAEVCCLAV